MVGIASLFAFKEKTDMESKTEEIRARCTPTEYAALVALAQQEERGVSDALRWVVREVAKQRGVWPLPAQPASLPGRTVDKRLPQAGVRSRIAREEIK